MTTDARIAIDLPGHPKTKKLIKRLGTGSAWHLIRLFLWVAGNRTDGDLSGMADEDIELAVDWSGDIGVFIAQLVEIGFVDGNEKERRVHDWARHNPWASGAAMRSAKAKWNSIKRHHGEQEADRQVPEYKAVRSEGSNSADPSCSIKHVAASDAASNTSATDSNALSPPPYPPPSLIPDPFLKPSPMPAIADQQLTSRSNINTAVIELPSQDGSPFPISKGQIADWILAYPALDIRLELQRMKVWLDANPTRRKTKRGMPRFITQWLAKDSEQADQGKRSAGAPFKRKDFRSIDYREGVSNDGKL